MQAVPSNSAHPETTATPRTHMCTHASVDTHAHTHTYKHKAVTPGTEPPETHLHRPIHVTQAETPLQRVEVGKMQRGPERARGGRRQGASCQGCSGSGTLCGFISIMVPAVSGCTMGRRHQGRPGQGDAGAKGGLARGRRRQELLERIKPLSRGLSQHLLLPARTLL